jgi:hypothetical protein
MKYITHQIFILVSILTFIIQGCGGGANNSSSPNNPGNGSVTDTEKPHITLQGDKTILLNIGDPFTDPGATALDNIDGDISSSISKEPSSIDTSIAGTYEIIYTVTDKAGNVDTASRTIIVLDALNNPESKKASGIVINEVLAINSHTNIDPDFKQFSDWIELYNNTNNNMSIGGYYLSDDPNNFKKWRIPNGTIIPAKERLLIWADKKDTALHTNFSLDGDGETLILSNKSGNAVDKITFKKQKRDISVTKIGELNYYMYPTPKTKNTIATNALIKSKKPIFNKESGFYNGSQTITLTNENGGTVYYTTDGSIPTLQSKHSINPSITINKTTIIRARSLEKGKFLSSIANQTFLIDENVHLPVVSIGIDNDLLFDDYYGIYVAGKDKNGNPIDPEDMSKAHYYQRWIRPASFELIKDNKSQFSINLAVKIHGDGSRTRPQKSLDFYTKSQFGTKELEYPLFRYKPYIKKVKSFMLRKSTASNPFRDGMAQTMIKDDFDIDYQSYEPVVVFINGKYWGILNIREKQNEDYFAANHNVDPDKLNIGIVTNIENHYEIKAGDIKRYIQLREYIKNTTNTNSIEFKNRILSEIDINEYLDYLIGQTFMNCYDWTFRNVKFWNEQKEGSKWRWALFDWDTAFTSSLPPEGNNNPNNPFYFAFNPNSTYSKTPSWSTLIRRKVLENDDIKQMFVSKYCTYLNTSFKSSVLKKKLDKLTQEVQLDTERHFKRWQNYGNNSKYTNAYYNGKINAIYSFITSRSNDLRTILANWFNYSGNNILTINPPANGEIYINNIKLKENFTGEYFNNTVVTLKAKPNNGYKFVKWSNGNTNRIMKLTLNNDININAIFEKTTNPKIVINEINYKSSKDHNSGDWIELYNREDHNVNISGWIIKDDSLSAGYIIPENTILKSNSYLVVCEDKTKFRTVYNSNINIIGNLPFGLSKSEDSIKLYNIQEALIDEVNYDNNWPDAKANGKTLSLIDPASDNSISTNWIAADNYGTPGNKN